MKHRYFTSEAAVNSSRDVSQALNPGTYPTSTSKQSLKFLEGLKMDLRAFGLGCVELRRPGLFIMKPIDRPPDKLTDALQRWCNQPEARKSCSFFDYKWGSWLGYLAYIKAGGNVG